MKGVLKILFVLFFSVNCYSQNSLSEVPIYFGQYFNDLRINPAYLSSFNKVDLIVGHRRNTNNFGGISSSFATASFQIKAPKNGFHVLGGEFTNEKEGFILRRNRLYGVYARHLQLNQQYSLSLGVALGFYNFGILQSNALNGVSNYAFDGSAGLHFYSNKTRLGLSINQFSNSTVRPIDQMIHLSRHYNLTASHTLKISEALEITPSIFLRYINSNNAIGMNSWSNGETINLLIKNLIQFGGSYEYDQGIYFLLGIHNIKINKKESNGSRVDVDLSYFIPKSQNTRANIRTYEIIMRYFIKK